MKTFEGIEWNKPVKIIDASRNNELFRYAEYEIYGNGEDHTVVLEKLSGDEYIKLDYLKQLIKEGEVFYVCKNMDNFLDSGLLYVDKDDNLLEKSFGM